MWVGVYGHAMALIGTHNISKSLHGLQNLRTFLQRLQNIQNPYTGYNTHDIPSQNTEYADYKTYAHSITDERGMPPRIKKTYVHYTTEQKYTRISTRITKHTNIPSQNTKYTSISTRITKLGHSVTEYKIYENIYTDYKTYEYRIYKNIYTDYKTYEHSVTEYKIYEYIYTDYKSRASCHRIQNIREYLHGLQNI